MPDDSVLAQDLGLLSPVPEMTAMSPIRDPGLSGPHDDGAQEQDAQGQGRRKEPDPYQRQAAKRGHCGDGVRRRGAAATVAVALTRPGLVPTALCMSRRRAVESR